MEQKKYSLTDGKHNNVDKTLFIHFNDKLRYYSNGI